MGTGSSSNGFFSVEKMIGLSGERGVVAPLYRWNNNKKCKSNSNGLISEINLLLFKE